MNFKHFFGKQNSKEMQNSIKITAFSWKAFDLGIKHFWMVLQSLLVENEANNPILLYCGCCPFQVDVAQETGTHMDLLTILKSKVVWDTNRIRTSTMAMSWKVKQWLPSITKGQLNFNW